MGGSFCLRRLKMDILNKNLFKSNKGVNNFD